MQNGVWASTLDALGNGIGYSWVLILVATVRELLGAGTVLGYEILPTSGAGGWFEPNAMMLQTPSAFFLLALLVWCLQYARRRHDASAARLDD